MGRLVVNNAMTVNGAFEAPVPEPDGWLVLDAVQRRVHGGQTVRRASVGAMRAARMAG
jgi:hypothetical protein